MYAHIQYTLYGKTLEAENLEYKMKKALASFNNECLIKHSRIAKTMEGPTSNVFPVYGHRVLYRK